MLRLALPHMQRGSAAAAAAMAHAARMPARTVTGRRALHQASVMMQRTAAAAPSAPAVPASSSSASGRGAGASTASWAALGLLLASSGLGLALVRDEAAAQPALVQPSSAAAALPLGASLYSFGNNLFGALGQGDAVSRAVPTLVGALAHAGPLQQIVAAGNHAAALSQDGRVYTWGSGVGGVLGQGAAVAGGGSGGDAARAGNCTQPALVEALVGRRIVHLALSQTHAAAVELLPDGSSQVWTWGSRALGVPTAPDDSTGTINRTRANRGKIDIRSTGAHDSATPVLATLPQKVPKLRHENVVAVACGKEHTLALTADGRVFSFGSDRDGALGLGDLEPRAEPTLVESLLQHGPVVCMAAGTGSSLFVTAQGTLLACGANDRGQAGTAATQRRYPSPVVVPLRDATAVSTSAFHVCALDVNGTLHSFGLNNEGQGGVGNRNLEHRQPVPVDGALAAHKVRSVSAGFGHTAAVTTDGKLFVWGRGREGQHGRGDQLESIAAWRDSPVESKFFATHGLTVLQTAAGADFTLALVKEDASHAPKTTTTRR